MTQTIPTENGDFRNACDLSNEKRRTLIRENPVTAARMFDFRFHKFLNEVMSST